MADALKKFREALAIPPAPLWSYPERTGYFDSDSGCSCAACSAINTRFPDLKSQAEIDDEAQGDLAPALRVVQGYLTYAVAFAAGWFFCAAFQLARLKGWL